MKLLGFVKKCVVTSTRVNPDKCFRNSDDCQCETEDEMDRLKVVNTTSAESVVKTSTALSSDNITSYSISTPEHIEHLPLDCVHPILLVKLIRCCPGHDG